MLLPQDHAAFPLWLELSGLPLHLNAAAKSPLPWLVFKKIVELDISINRMRPGLVETPLAELAARCGLEADKLEKPIKALRKAAVLRAFLPDHAEEPALLQIITPVPTPRSHDEVRAVHSQLFLEADWPPRYAVAIADEDDPQREKPEEKVKRVVELYFNVFSMKINSLILDQLQLISDRYEEDLIRKVFLKARQQEATSLGWIMTEIRRELKFKAKAEEIRSAER